MKPPRKVKVHPFTLSVVEVPGLEDAGLYQPPSSTILLRGEQTDETARDTLLHELLHAIVGQGLGQAFKDVDKEFEETVVSILAPRVLALIRDNPTLVEYLIEP